MQEEGVLDKLEDSFFIKLLWRHMAKEVWVRKACATSYLRACESCKIISYPTFSTLHKWHK